MENAAPEISPNQFMTSNLDDKRSEIRWDELTLPRVREAAVEAVHEAAFTERMGSLVPPSLANLNRRPLSISQALLDSSENQSEAEHLTPLSRGFVEFSGHVKQTFGNEGGNTALTSNRKQMDHREL